MAPQFTLSTSLNVNVVTPRGQITEIETNAVTAPGELGEFEILPGHIPFLTSLHPGVMIIGEGEEASVYAVSRGYLRVDRSGAVEVLVERVVAGQDVDVKTATEERDEARAALDEWKLKPQDAEWKNLKDRFEWAQARLDAQTRA
ncbi:MAG: ATP synthase F1 subunit epsilon [Proteobacteria bacterium]|nr:ATP synthase F1 subunit epsilon [Pseudomonadota bacterium]